MLLLLQAYLEMLTAFQPRYLLKLHSFISSNSLLNNQKLRFEIHELIYTGPLIDLVVIIDEKT